MAAENFCDNDDGCRREQFAALDDFIATSSRNRDALIPVLHRAQDIFGHLPVPVQSHVARAMRLPVSEVYGVVSFYHYFTMQPRGRHTINVCLGTACYVRGAKKVVETLCDQLKIRMGDTTPDRRFSLRTQRCFGACGLAPVIMINNDVHGRVTPRKVAAILARYE